MEHCIVSPVEITIKRSASTRNLVFKNLSKQSQNDEAAVDCTAVRRSFDVRCGG